MPVHTEIEPTKQLTIHTVRGEVAFDECITALKAFYSGNPTLNVIWDFSDGTLARLSSVQIEMLADFVSGLSERRRGGKTAGIVPRSVDFGLGRMFSAFAEMKGYKPEVRLFRQRKDAIDWILDKGWGDDTSGEDQEGFGGGDQGQG